MKEGMLDVYDFHINPAELLGYNAMNDAIDTGEVLSLIEDQLYEVDYFDVPYRDIKIKRWLSKNVLMTVILNDIKAVGYIEYNIKTGMLTATCDGLQGTKSINIHHPGFKAVHESIAWICMELSKLMKSYCGVSIA